MTVDKALKPVAAAEVRAALKDLPHAPRMPTPSSRYGIACIAAERSARNEAQTGPRTVEFPALWYWLLCSLAAPGPWEMTDPMLAAVRAGQDGFKLRRLLRNGQTELSLADLDPIGPGGARSLAAQGVFTADGLLRRAAHPADRDVLAKAVGADAALIERWAHLAELAVVLSIALTDYSGWKPNPLGLVSLAALATIANVSELAGATPIVLADGMWRANETETIVPKFSVAEAEPLVTRWRLAAENWKTHIGRPDAVSMVRPAPPKPAEVDEEAESTDKKAAEKPKEGPADGGD